MGDTDATKATKPATSSNLSIIEWVQSFRINMAIQSKSQPHHVADLLGYQTLILQAYQEFRVDFWLRYDRTFRQKAVTLKDAKWAAIDTTLWCLAFSGWGQPSSSPDHVQDKGSSRYYNPSPRTPRQPPVCYSWYKGNCNFRNCKFPHKCSYCIMDSGITDAFHNASNCPLQPGLHPLPLPQHKRLPWKP